MDELLIKEISNVATVVASKNYVRLNYVAILDKNDLMQEIWCELLKKINKIYVNNQFIFELAFKIACDATSAYLGKSYDGAYREYYRRGAVVAVDRVAFASEKSREWAAAKVDIDLKLYEHTLAMVEHQRFQSIDDLPFIYLSKLSDNDSHLDREVNNAKINTALAVLTDIELQVITATYYHGLVDSEVANKIGCTIKTVQCALQRGKRRLKASMSKP